MCKKRRYKVFLKIAIPWMLMPSKILHQSINKFVGKYVQQVRCWSSARIFTRSFIFKDFFSIHWEHLIMFVIHFFWLQYVKQEFTLLVSLLFQKIKLSVLFSANWLLLIVIDKFAKRNSFGHCFRRSGKFPRQRLQWTSTVKLSPTNNGFVNYSRLTFSLDFQNTEELSRGVVQK